MRRILVTGANKGIGLAIATAILEQHDDTVVLLGSRDAGRGQAACDGLLAAHGDWKGRVEVVEIDVSSDGSVAAAAKSVAAKYGDEPAPLYGVVNNAGVGFGDFELRGVLEVNTFGLKRVCDAFLPLVRPADGRIVNITSAAGPNFVHECSEERQRFFLDASVSWEQLQGLIDECLKLSGEDAFNAAGLGNGNPYGLSKALGNSYTMMLARQHPGLRVNACTPGFIETDLTRPYAESRGVSAADMGMKSPVEGTKSAMFLLFGDLEGNGRYYGSDAKRSPLDRYRAPGSAEYNPDP